MQPPIHVNTRSPTSLTSLAPLRLMPNWGLLSNTFLVEHESDILMTCPSHGILPAFATVRMLGPPYSSSSSWFILLLHAPCSNTPPKTVRSLRRSNMSRAFAFFARVVHDSCPSWGLEDFWIAYQGRRCLPDKIVRHLTSTPVRFERFWHQIRYTHFALHAVQGGL